MGWMHPITDSSQFPVCNWSDFYGKVEEPIWSNSPEAIGKAVDVCLFVDSDHAGDKHMHRFCTGLFVPQYCTYQLVF